jgi:tol-pal system protein YbgF
MAPKLKTKARLALLLLLSSTSLAGCATKGDLRNLRLEMQGLAARQDSILAALAVQARMAQENLRGTTGELGDIRGTFNNQLRSLSERLDEVRQDNAQMVRLVNQMKTQLDEAVRQMNSLSAQVTRATAAAEAAAAAASAGPPPPGGDMSSAPSGTAGAPAGSTTTPGSTTAGGRATSGSPTTAAPPPAPVVSSPSNPAPLATGTGEAFATYNAGVNQLNRGNIVSARTAFTDIVSRFPNHELAPEAQYRLGEIFVIEGRQTEAIAAFDKIPQLYPRAPKVPDALYQVGVLYMQSRASDAKANARRYFERVIQNYGTSAAATQAAARLKELGPP